MSGHRWCAYELISFSWVVRVWTNTFVNLRVDVWVLLVECGTLDSDGDDCGCGAIFGSTMVACSASVLGFWMNCSYFSTLPWTRILKCLVFVLTQNGEECSADAPVSVLVALVAPGNLEILSRLSRGWR